MKTKKSVPSVNLIDVGTTYVSFDSPATVPNSLIRYWADRIVEAPLDSKIYVRPDSTTWSSDGHSWDDGRGISSVPIVSIERRTTSEEIRDGLAALHDLPGGMGHREGDLIVSLYRKGRKVQEIVLAKVRRDPSLLILEPTEF